MWRWFEAFQCGGVGVALESQDFTWGKEPGLVVVESEKASKVVGDVEVGGAVASGECGCWVVGIDL